MKSVVAQRYGGPEVVELVDRHEPVLDARDVLIEVRAASLNPLDFKLREGKVKLALPLKPPIALGCDVAGVVSATGGEVTKFNVGDEVFARLEKMRMGGLAERVAAHEDVIAKKPQRASFVESAAVPLTALTALQALRECAAAKPGQRVLIHAGAGGVGSLAIQIAKILGLHVITTTSTKNIQFVTSLGADEVIDYTKEKVTERARDLDVVFDTLGTTEIESIGLVKRGGVVVGIGGMPDGEFAKKWMAAWTRPLIWAATAKRRLAASRAGVRFVYLFMRPDGAELSEIATWIDEGRLKPIVHKEYPLAEFRDAFAELERGHARGKIVLTVPAT